MEDGPFPVAPAAVAVAGHDNEEFWWAFTGEVGPHTSPDTPIHPLEQQSGFDDFEGPSPVEYRPSVEPSGLGGPAAEDVDAMNVPASAPPRAAGTSSNEAGVVPPREGASGARAGVSGRSGEVVEDAPDVQNPPTRASRASTDAKPEEGVDEEELGDLGSQEHRGEAAGEEGAQLQANSNLNQGTVPEGAVPTGSNIASDGIPPPAG